MSILRFVKLGVILLLFNGQYSSQAQSLIDLYAPKNFQVASDHIRDVSLLLTWTAVPKASHYKIYIKPPTPSASGIGGNILTSYSLVEGLNSNTEYEFTLFAAHGESLSIPSVFVQRTALQAPENVAVVQDSLSHNSMTVRWSPVPGKDSYVITMQPAMGVIGAGDGIYTEERSLRGLSPNTQYTITISARNWVGDGASHSIKQATKLPPPQNMKLVKEMLTPNTIGVQWNEVTGANNYVVTYSPSIVPPQIVHDTYVVIGKLDPDTEYNVKVATANVAGQSSFQTLRVRTLSECYLSPNDFTEKKFGIICPKHCLRQQNLLYGSGEYTTDSYICAAAIHDGRITNSLGGYVMVKKKNGLQFFTGTTQNEITSDTYRYPHESFVFALQPPKNLSVVGLVQDDKFVVQWNPVRGATMYRISVVPSQGRDDILKPETKVILGNLIANTSYVVYVVATSHDETSEAAKLTRTTALPASNFVEVVNSSAQSTNFTITWKHVNGATSYLVTVKNQQNIILERTTMNSTIFVKGLKGGTLYNISVNAINQNGIGRPATTSRFTSLSKPKHLSVAVVTSETMKIIWNKVYGATEYKLRISPCCYGIQTVSQPLYWLKNLTSNTEYTVEVVASNMVDDSLPASIKQRTALASPDEVRVVPGKLTHDSAVISWKQLQSATNYVAIIDGNVNQRIVLNETIVMIQDLFPNSNHTIVVFGKNSVGDGKRSFLQFTTLLPPPRNVRFVRIQTSSSVVMNVEWAEEVTASSYTLFCEPATNILGIGNNTKNPSVLTGFSAGEVYNVSLMARSGLQFSSNVTYHLNTRKTNIPLVVACFSTFSRFVVLWQTSDYQVTRISILSDGNVSQNQYPAYDQTEIVFGKLQLNVIKNLEIKVYASHVNQDSDVFIENILESKISLGEKKNVDTYYANLFWLSAFPKTEYEVVTSTSEVDANTTLFHDARAKFKLQKRKQYVVSVNVAGHSGGMSIQIPSFFQQNEKYPEISTKRTELSTNGGIFRNTPKIVDKAGNESGETWIVIVIIVGIIVILFFIICIACAWEMCWRKPLLRNAGCCGCGRKEEI